MPQTLIEKIFSSHAGRSVKAGDIVDLAIDVRVARDFGGASVVQNLREHRLPVRDPGKTFFTFDCYPGGTDARYATNQQICRTFAREQGGAVFDMNAGIGTHLAIDRGLVGPGQTFVSTDSHANILGAIGAFGQGMGDQDVAAAWAHGTTWFKTPSSVRILLAGAPSPRATAKDMTLALLKHFGAGGLLGHAAEVEGEAADRLNLEGRITMASMCTEMGGIILLFPPDGKILDELAARSGRRWEGIRADAGAAYEKSVEIDLTGLEPQIARPGRPEDVVDVSAVAGRRVDSVFIGSCTNGRYADIAAAAEILKGRRIAPHVVLKIVPSTDAEWRRLLDDGIFHILNNAGALISNPGCAGCAAGQVGQNGPGEVTVSTGNRNFAGKQGKGEVWLASPETAAASAVAGAIATKEMLGREGFVSLHGSHPVPRIRQVSLPGGVEGAPQAKLPESDIARPARPTRVRGRVRLIPVDNIDTDMIFHNRYLNITDVAQMGQYTFDNLKGWEEFAKNAAPGDIIVTGKNFGAGSSRQQAVDCFISLGISAIVAESFGSIYERNAINAGLPILCGSLLHAGLAEGDVVELDFAAGEATEIRTGNKLSVQPFSAVQMDIYRRGGLFGNEQ